MSLATLGELNEAIESAPWVAKELKPRMTMVGAQNLMGKGNYALAASEFYRARTLLRAQKRDDWAAVAAAEGALALLAIGNVDEAVTTAELGLRWYNESPQFHTELMVRLAYAKVMNATGNQKAALIALGSATTIDADSDWQPHVEFRVELAKAESLAGDIKTAAATASILLEFFANNLSLGDRAAMQEILAEAAVEAINLPLALSHFSDAIATHTAGLDLDQVSRLSARLKDIANGELNRRNNEVIEGL
jgi:tetratricopeptide (TPR) repeat protein